jgi:hypothetical protein
VNKDSSNRCGNQSASAFVSAMLMGNRFCRTIWWLIVPWFLLWRECKYSSSKLETQRIYTDFLLASKFNEW